MNTLIHVESLTKRYGDFLLDSLDLTVAEGSIVGFIGANGAGKTTTIKAILGLITPDSGHIKLFDGPVNPSDQALERMKQSIGIVLDSCSFPPDYRVADVPALGRALYRSWDYARFEQLCRSFQLEASKRIKELSRGMGMKLSSAFALAHHPRLLILDEATAGLDPLAREELLDLLRTFMEEENGGECGILLSSHITSDLEKIADEIVCIDKGQLIFTLPKDDICDKAGIIRCRKDELGLVLASGLIDPRTLYRLDQSHWIELLVPDRFSIERLFPQLNVERCTIEDYMTVRLRGQVCA